MSGLSLIPGHYVCVGAKGDCAKVASALKRVEAASKNKANTAKTTQVLAKIVGFYGKPDVANGVRVEPNTAGSHGIDQKRDGMTNIRAEIKEGETRAGIAESHFAQGSGWDQGGLLKPDEH